MVKISAGLILGLWALATSATAAEVLGVRLWIGPDNNRVVFDLSGPVSYRLFTMSSPDRVVIDFSDTRLNPQTLPALDYSGSFIKGMRHARQNAKTLRFVFDAHKAIRPEGFLLQPNEVYGHRLVLDLYDPSAPAQTTPALDTPVAKVAPSASAVTPIPVITAEVPLRDVVIAIDAGHGGEDPGAKGYHGTYEKEIVLAIARRLHAQINREKGMRAVMIRDGDYYLGLRQRIEKARAHKADLFVSIHADAYRDRRAHGAAVYVLSQNGASSEAARWLAESENSSDLVGGIRLDDKDELLASVLLDLSQDATMASSHDAASRVLEKLKGLSKLHHQRVERAGFVVLKSPDIPSLLIETGFISNPSEEKKLRQARHQEALAQALVRGIRDYFDHAAPAGTKFAQREHVIGKGETLSSIANTYGITITTLRVSNRLQGNQVKEGMILRIPARGDT